jgi:DNA repair exonuclease SbcCD ATPase subunit
MVCSCQKQDSAAEQQAAQQKVELDAREKALDERMNALDEKVNALREKVNALGEKEQDIPSDQTAATDIQGETPDPAQVQAENERIMQEFSAQMRALAPNYRDRMPQNPSTQGPTAQQESQNQQQYKKKLMSGGAVFPSAETKSRTPSPAVENALPIASPTP